MLDNSKIADGAVAIKRIKLLFFDCNMLSGIWDLAGSIPRNTCDAEVEEGEAHVF